MTAKSRARWRIKFYHAFALGLAQIMRTGWYREVGVKSLDNHKIRAVPGRRWSACRRT